MIFLTVSFSIQKIIYCFFNHFNNWFLIICTKIIKGHKYPQVDPSETEKILEFDKHNSDRYILFHLFFSSNKIKPLVKKG